MEQLDARKIATRYAKALLEAAEEQNAFKAVAQDFRALQRLMLEVPELNSFLTNPGIPLAEKQALITQQFQKGLSPLVGNLLALLVENDRLALLPEVIAVGIELIQQKEGIAKADVVVPVVLNDRLENQLRETLEKLYGYQQVELNVQVDPGIIAGAIIKIGDKMIDGSYRGKLEMLQRQVG